VPWRLEWNLTSLVSQCSGTSVGHFPPGHIPPDIFSRQFHLPDNFSPNLGHFHRMLKQIFFWKLAPTRIPDPNRSTSIKFVHVNGRSLYIVDRRMVVVEGGYVLHHVKGGIFGSGNIRGIFPGEGISTGELMSGSIGYNCWHPDHTARLRLPTRSNHVTHSLPAGLSQVNRLSYSSCQAYLAVKVDPWERPAYLWPCSPV